jgi:tRNA G18 (ribose-2'-O)-methylase SpoU
VAMNAPPTESAQTLVSAAALAGRELELLLYGLQSPINIGMILRVAETYQFQVSIYDQHHVLEDAAKVATIADFACGALTRHGFRDIKDEAALAQMLQGRRLVATSIARSTASLLDHRFQRADIYALGNEYDGLPDKMLAGADVVLNIPMPEIWTPKPKSFNPIDLTRTKAVARDGQPNLNVAMSAGIICYAAFVYWLEHESAATVGNG